MNVAALTVLVASAAALFLVVRTAGRARRFAALALLAAAAEAWLVFRNIESQNIHLAIVQPAALLGAGGLSWLMTESKPAVTAATIVTLVGAIRLVGVLSLG